MYIRTQVTALKKAATDAQGDFIQYQTTSHGATSSTQQGSSAVQYALPHKTTANNNPGVSIYVCDCLSKNLPCLCDCNHCYYNYINLAT